ncbi:MAG: hypothetical protein QGH39_08900 [Candidatus Thermoplasmatota archaeon]|jgi:homoaconitase/3-isopropylmalate dehydratase large subunit|nr:hypothetical protein [Candidatus Thermoplasmatota archaeon]
MMEWTEKFTRWLKKGKEDATKVLDMPWDIEVKVEEDKDIITAVHPKIPFPVVIHVTKEFANIYMDTGVPTDTIDVEERMRAYKKLLYINTNLNLMKTGLIGEEQRVVLIVDLSLTSLNKTEFNEAITAISFGAHHVVEALGLTKELSNALLKRTAIMVSDKVKGGETKEDIMKFLIQRVGMKKEYAVEFMKKVMSTIEAAEKAGEPDLIYIQ